MRSRPGPNLLYAVAAIAVIAAGAFGWPGLAWLLPFFLAALVPPAAWEFRRSRAELAGLLVERRLPDQVGRGRAFAVTLELTGLPREPRRLTLREFVPTDAEPRAWSEEIEARGEARIARARSFQIGRRGRHEFGPAWVRLAGPLGLFEAQRLAAPVQAIKVLPESIASREELTKTVATRIQELERLAKTRRRGEGIEFESLAEFRVGDDPRRIDWRSSARLRRPVVRRYQIEQHRDVVLLIDCGRLMGAATGGGTKLDRAIDSALVLAAVALGHGDRCGLGIFDYEVLGFLPPGMGPETFRHLVEHLHDLQSRWRETDFGTMFATLERKQPKRSLVVVLSDLVDEETSGRFRASLARLARRHVVVFVALQTPYLKELARAPLTTAEDLSRHAVAFRLLRQRQRAIHSVRRSGVDVLDVLPTELTVPLINRFVELRERNVL